jgi:large subunit ribosomal protein L21
MYAIVEIAGQQFKIEKDKKIFVHRLNKNEGDKVEFEKVLLVDDEGKIKIGTPVLEGAKISAKVIEHVRGEKVKIFKKKRRKGYQKLSGHRQDFTQIEIESITI